MSKITDEFNKNFQIGAQGLQACNASIAQLGHVVSEYNQQIEYLLYENQIRKQEMESTASRSLSDEIDTIDDELDDEDGFELIGNAQVVKHGRYRKLIDSVRSPLFPHDIMLSPVKCIYEKKLEGKKGNSILLDERDILHMQNMQDRPFGDTRLKCPIIPSHILKIEVSKVPMQDPVASKYLFPSLDLEAVSIIYKNRWMWDKEAFPVDYLYENHLKKILSLWRKVTQRTLTLNIKDMNNFTRFWIRNEIQDLVKDESTLVRQLSCGQYMSLAKIDMYCLRAKELYLPEIEMSFLGILENYCEHQKNITHDEGKKLQWNRMAIQASLQRICVDVKKYLGFIPGQPDKRINVWKARNEFERRCRSEQYLEGYEIYKLMAEIEINNNRFSHARLHLSDAIKAQVENIGNIYPYETKSSELFMQIFSKRSQVVDLDELIYRCEVELNNNDAVTKRSILFSRHMVELRILRSDFNPDFEPSFNDVS